MPSQLCDGTTADIGTVWEERKAVINGDRLKRSDVVNIGRWQEIMKRRFALPTLAAIGVAVLSGSYAIWLMIGLHTADALPRSMVMTPIIAFVATLLSAPFALLIGGLPAAIGVIGLGRPIHRELVRRGLTGVRHYALAGLASGVVAALGLGLYLSSVNALRTDFWTVTAVVTLACLFGGSMSATVFRLLLKPSDLVTGANTPS